MKNTEKKELELLNSNAIKWEEKNDFPGKPLKPFCTIAIKDNVKGGYYSPGEITIKDFEDAIKLFEEKSKEKQEILKTPSGELINVFK